MRVSRFLGAIAFALALLSAGCCCSDRCCVRRPFWRFREGCCSPCSSCCPTACCSSPHEMPVPPLGPPMMSPPVGPPLAPPLAPHNMPLGPNNNHP